MYGIIHCITSKPKQIMQYAVKSGHYGETYHYEGLPLEKAQQMFKDIKEDFKRDIQTALNTRFENRTDWMRDTLNLYHDDPASISLTSISDDGVEIIDEILISDLA